MADIKINGNKYNGIERVKFAGADGVSTVSFMDASILENLITGTLTDVFYDTQITSIENANMFRGANIGVINMPNVKSIAFQAFQSCKATEIRFEGLQTFKNGSTFLSMPNLTKAVFGTSCMSLPSQCFNACSKLATLVLPYNGVVSINVTSSNASLLNTAIANGTGYVYVPSAQVDNYKADTNWATYADQIRAIEDYPDEVA